MSFILLGSYLKNDIDITGEITDIFINVVSFQSMYERIGEAAPSTLNYMAWSLYIFSSRCFAPGTETPQLMLSAQACVQKLTEILPLVQYL